MFIKLFIPPLSLQKDLIELLNYIIFVGYFLVHSVIENKNRYWYFHISCYVLQKSISFLSLFPISHILHIIKHQTSNSREEGVITSPCHPPPRRHHLQLHTLQHVIVISASDISPYLAYLAILPQDCMATKALCAT